ncbi:MAG: ABC transporter ATP-binding protein [bacterium]|nr:ABC transporter ATP-binding protein [bacterium]
MTGQGGTGPPVLELVGLTKRYGDVVACDRVDLLLYAGEIHGILGENGAGKSTLMRLAFGLASPDSGTVKIDGTPREISDPIEASKWGIGMVHQHYSLVDALTVWENVALGEAGRLDPETTRGRIREISERYGLAVDPDAPVRNLPAGIRQRVEIIKCLCHDPRIILLDEPTSALTPHESEQLFEVLAEGARSESWAVALVSHKLDEILRATDRISVMRAGRVVDRKITGEADVPSLARAMVGRPVSLRTVTATLQSRGLQGQEAEHGGASGPATEPAMLRVRHASTRGEDEGVLLDDLSVRVRAGEIVGVAGVEGNGQTALSDVLASLLQLDQGEVLVDGEAVPTGVAGAMAAAGVAVIPADRHRSGCVLEMTVAENLMIPLLDRMRRHGFLRREAINRNARQLMDEYGIVASGRHAPLEQLSGGNQQRVVVARALAAAPRVVVAHQPTRGLDVGAIEYVADRLRRAAEEGLAILLLSTDLREIMALADRVVVIHRGTIVGEMARHDLDMEHLGLLMGGTGQPESLS